MLSWIIKIKHFEKEEKKNDISELIKPISTHICFFYIYINNVRSLKSAEDIDSYIYIVLVLNNSEDMKWFDLRHQFI
jgi:hypothetical protein